MRGSRSRRRVKKLRSPVSTFAETNENAPPRSRYRQIEPWRPSRLFLERVEHVHCFWKRGDVQHALFYRHVNSDLAYASSYLCHRPPVGGLHAD